VKKFLVMVLIVMATLVSCKPTAEVVTPESPTDAVAQENLRKANEAYKDAATPAVPPPVVVPEPAPTPIKPVAPAAPAPVVPAVAPVAVPVAPVSAPAAH
jgi:hypothetical protein